MLQSSRGCMLREISMGTRYHIMVASFDGTMSHEDQFGWQYEAMKPCIGW